MLKFRVKIEICGGDGEGRRGLGGGQRGLGRGGEASAADGEGSAGAAGGGEGDESSAGGGGRGWAWRGAVEGSVGCGAVSVHCVRQQLVSNDG